MKRKQKKKVIWPPGVEEDAAALLAADRPVSLPADYPHDEYGLPIVIADPDDPDDDYDDD